MRITYIHQHFSLPNEPGGQRPWEFARRLVKDGHQVTVICGGQKQQMIDVEGVQIMRLSAPYDNTMSTPKRLISFSEFMIKAAKSAVRTKADLVFASSTPLTAAIPGIFAAYSQNVPFVFEVRDLWPEVPAQLGIIKNRSILYAARALEKFAYRAAEHVIALSPGMAEGVSRVSPATPVTVVPNASDFALFKPHAENRASIRSELGWTEEETVIVYAGSFGDSYDVPWLVELAKELYALPEKFRVVIYGRGASSERMMAEANLYGIEAEDLLPGPIPKSQVAKVLPAADYAASTMIDQPALEVNSLNKVFDALAAGTPVVFNHGGWLPDLLESVGAGLKLSRDTEEAALQLQALARSGSARQMASTAASNLGGEQFARDKLYLAFREVLEKAATIGAGTRSHLHNHELGRHRNHQIDHKFDCSELK